MRKSATPRFSEPWRSPECLLPLTGKLIPLSAMALHPQIAALAAQLEDLSCFLRSHGDRLWSGRIDLCRHLVADSNFAGVDRFLRLFEGEEGLDSVTLPDSTAHARLAELRRNARTVAERLAREEQGD